MSSVNFEVKPYPEMWTSLDLDVPRFDKARQMLGEVSRRMVAILAALIFFMFPLPGVINRRGDSAESTPQVRWAFLYQTPAVW
jgi:hypothetical protein